MATCLLTNILDDDPKGHLDLKYVSGHPYTMEEVDAFMGIVLQDWIGKGNKYLSNVQKGCGP